MELNTNENNAFLMVLNKMDAGGYLQKGEAENIKAAYFRYVHDLINKKIGQPHQTQTNQTIFRDDDKRSSDIPRETTPEPVRPHVMTKEEVRERNISWVLNIGVVLILLSGIIFGTTTWEFMNNIGKVILLCSASVIFFVISIIAKTVVKIPKSGSAFWIMGSLFFPISLLSIGFFKLLGENLSVWGEGKYLFGILCSLLCLPIYIWSTYRNKSRTFAWITLINITLLYVFGVLSFHPTNGMFSLLLLEFNGLLLVVSLVAKRISKFPLFINELPWFLQFNLILSAAITLFAFDSSYLYSVNIVLAAMLFLAISLSQKKVGYDYVFGLFFTGGMYLISREFASPSASYIIIPIIGYIFTGLSLLVSKDVARGKRYQIFSGISALLGFIYVGISMLPATSLQDSIIALISLCVIAANYLYLSHKSTSAFFGVLVPIQVLAIFYESANLLRAYSHFKYTSEFLLLMTILLFVVGYLFNHVERFQAIKKSSLVSALVNTVIIFFMCMVKEPLLISLSAVSFVFTAELFVASRKLKDDSLKVLLNYCISFLVFGSLCLIWVSYPIRGISSISYYFFCALFTFALHWIAVKRISDFKRPLFYTGHVLMAFLFRFVTVQNQDWLTSTMVYLVLAFVYVYSVLITDRREQILWFYAGLINFTLLTGNVLSQIHHYFTVDLTRYHLYLCGFLLIGFYYFLKKQSFKKHIAIYLCVLTAILTLGNLLTTNMLWYEYVAEIVFAALLCLCLFHSDLDLLGFIPLSLVFTANHILLKEVVKGNLTALSISIAWFIILLIIGIRKYLFLLDTQNKQVDWFSLLALISIFNLHNFLDFNIPWLTSMLPGLMGAVWFYLNRNRFTWDNRLGKLFFTLSLLWPYYSLLSSINSHIQNYIYEFVLLPLVLLTYICTKWIYYQVKNSFLTFLEYLIPSIAYIILLSVLFSSDNITHGLILGIVGLISILYAIIIKIKSTLILGGALILTSVFIQTRTFWFSIQWWIYLLVLGTILIIIASINEYQKNKNNTDVISKMSVFFNKFSDWD